MHMASPSKCGAPAADPGLDTSTCRAVPWTPSSPLPLSVSSCTLGVAQVLFWKRRVKHFQFLFYKNKPLSFWYSVAPNLPLCLCTSPWSSGCCVPQPAAHRGCWCCTLLQASPGKHQGSGLVPFCGCLLFPGCKLATA